MSRPAVRGPVGAPGAPSSPGLPSGPGSGVAPGLHPSRRHVRIGPVLPRGRDRALRHGRRAAVRAAGARAGSASPPRGSRRVHHRAGGDASPL